MNIDLSELSQTQTYFTMTQTVLPRPVAWVLTEHANGKLNLAPFSYFTPVSSNPPLLMFSVGHKPDGSLKDTYKNVTEREHFVVHIAHSGLAEAVTQSAKVLPEGESELDFVGLDTVEFEGFPLPRLADAGIAFGCRLYQAQTIGDNPQYLVFGQIERMWIDDRLVGGDDKGRQKIFADRVDAIGRLGGNEYVTFGDIIDVPRPV